MGARYLEELDSSLRLRCPICGASMHPVAQGSHCSAQASHPFPHVGSVPVLLNAERSVFRADDFTRFTRSGHRWLFRRFVERDSGIATGPASVLVWSVEYFLLSWTTSVGWRRVFKALTRLGLGWLTLLDPMLGRRVAALDGAGGFKSLGTRADRAVVNAHAIIRYCRGADALT